MREGVEDVVFCFLRFPSGLAAHLHLSWLDPHKERRFTVVGSKKMATFDDMELERKLTVYDKGFDEDFTSYGEYIARSGDVYSPRVPQRRAAADRVPTTSSSACATAPTPRSDGAERPARGAGARGAAALARREPACSGRLTAPPGCSSARASSLPPTVELGGNVVIHAGTRGRRRGADPGRRGDRQAAGARRRTRRAARERAGARRDRRGRHRVRGRGGGGRARAIGERRRGRRPGPRARARGDRRGDAWWGAARRSTTT